MTIAYLGSSAIVRRYVLEPGSDAVTEVYGRTASSATMRS